MSSMSSLMNSARSTTFSRTSLAVLLCSLVVVLVLGTHQTSGQQLSEPTDNDSQQLMEEKRARFAFAKRRAFAFAKRDFGGKAFAFAKRSGPLEHESSEEQQPQMDKRFEGGYSRFAFAKRGSPSRFAFAKRWPTAGERSFAFA